MVFDILVGGEAGERDRKRGPKGNSEFPAEIKWLAVTYIHGTAGQTDVKNIKNGKAATGRARRRFRGCLTDGLP